MFRPLVRSHHRPPRRGTAILITCFFLITIMMVTGLALVMYAAREKAAALAYQEAGAGAVRVAPAPEGTVNAFLSALIYDTADDDVALQNSLRGHSIARGMYGSRPDYSNYGTVPNWTGSTTPWAGVGLFNEDANTYTGTSTYGALTGITAADQRNRARFVNHTAVTMSGQVLVLDPEWTGNRGAAASGAVPGFAANRAGKSYVGKHSGVVYPDLKSFFLGARDPYTGEVLARSFHRDWLFGSLDPSNPNWTTNEIGKLLTLRPRPKEHPLFPRVGPDADGVYRGDVQNLPGGYYYDAAKKQFFAKMDSLWMHIGLAPIRLSDGRLVQPMVAPLILPLDGLFDLSTHGNQLNAVQVSAGPPPVYEYRHTSYSGLGSWEVNIGKGTANDTDRLNLLAQRNPSQAAAFAPFTSPLPQPPGVPQLLPTYAPVAWNNPATATFALPDPASNSMRGLPTWTGFDSSNAAYSPHPAGYDSNEYGVRNNSTNPSSPVYPFTDLKRFSLRYAFTPDWYNQALATATAPTTFLGDPVGFPYFANPTASTQSGYRRDPAHTRRLSFSPRGMGLARPALAPNFLWRDVNGGSSAGASPALQIPANATKPGGLFAGAAMTATAYPSPQNVGPITDFAANNQWYNVQAALGSVDLNRQLADYRNDTTQALGTDTSATPGGHIKNAGNAAQAEADRQALAKDIFARFIVATGAAGQVSYDTIKGVQVALPDPTNGYKIGTGSVAYTVEQYNALRYLAQLAVNIVDYIDNDDISTTFVWNPSNSATPSAGYATDMLPTNVGNRVVFGVEKPRLLLNEVYSEITNAPADLPVDPVIDPVTMKPTALDMNAQAHVKFWAELVNATSAPHTAVTGVLGTGSVPLNAYQIQISRANRMTGPPAQQGDLATYLSNPANTAGRLGDPANAATAQPDSTFTFPLTPPPNTPSTVSPNDVSLGAQQYAPPQANLPAGGFVLVGPPQAVKMNSKEFTPPTTGVWATANKVESAAPTAATSSTGMGYTVTMPAAAELTKKEFKRHVVLLRRLTNPYMPVNDPNVTAPAYNSALPLNTYVTVDAIDYVPAFDAVHRAEKGVDDRGEWDMTNNPTGYDPVANRFSVGKVQPLAGLSTIAVATDFQDGAGKYNVYNGNNTRAVNSSLTASMVRDQTTPAPMPNPNNEPKHTFGRHNGNGVTPPAATTVSATTLTDTIMLPFDWQIHMDRPLETLGDVFFVRDCPPHRLTTEFVQPTIIPPATTQSLYYEKSYALWAQHNNGLARTLELLSVKPADMRVAHGGRVGGKINLNVVQDKRVIDGLWDAPATVGTANRFDQTFVTNNVWDKLMGLRSPMQTKYGADATTTFTSPVPTSSVLDVPAGATSGGGTDRPIMPLGTPTAEVGGFAYANPNAARDGDTVLRIDTTTGKPYLYQTAETHAYTRTEPLRKVMNNLTTVSHTYVVYLTIGYFDVKLLSPGDPGYPGGYPSNVNGAVFPQFGAEVFDQIPGDMRQKFISIIDMSNMALKASPPANDSDPHATVQPFFTALAATARAPVPLPVPPATTPVTLTLASGGGNGSTFSIPADGQTVTIKAGDTLILGYGLESQAVVVQSVGNTGPTVNQITVTGLVRDAWGGTCVSNVRPGYAGPRTDFDFNSAKYKPVVPYVERLR